MVDSSGETVNNSGTNTASDKFGESTHQHDWESIGVTEVAAREPRRYWACADKDCSAWTTASLGTAHHVSYHKTSLYAGDSDE